LKAFLVIGRELLETGIALQGLALLLRGLIAVLFDPIPQPRTLRLLLVLLLVLLLMLLLVLVVVLAVVATLGETSARQHRYQHYRHRNVIEPLHNHTLKKVPKFRSSKCLQFSCS